MKTGLKWKKRAELLRCILLCGSAWSTERKYMRRYTGKCDIFFGTEHRLRKEEVEEQFNKEAEERSIFAADAARSLMKEQVVRGRQHSLGGVFVAIDSNFGAVVGEREGRSGTNPRQ